MLVNKKIQGQQHLPGADLMEPNRGTKRASVGDNKSLNFPRVASERLQILTTCALFATFFGSIESAPGF